MSWWPPRCSSSQAASAVCRPRRRPGVGELNSYAEESINAIRTIQAFTHEPIDRRQFQAQLDRGVQASLRRARRRALLVATGFILGVAALTFCVWFGARAVASHDGTAGELLSFLFYASLVATSGGALMEVWGDFQRAAGAIERILDLLTTRPSIMAPAAPVPLPSPATGRVEFDAVAFHYPTRRDRPVLTDFTISVDRCRRKPSRWSGRPAPASRRSCIC